MRGGDEYESNGFAPSDFSGSEDDSEHVFTDAESEDNQISGNSSAESAEESDVEQVWSYYSRELLYFMSADIVFSLWINFILN